MTIEQKVQVPDIGDFKDVAVIEILVKPGDAIHVDTPVIVLETDKATMEVPSPLAGVIQDIAVKVGDRLNKGDRLLTLLGEDAMPLAPPAVAEIEVRTEPAVPVVVAAPGLLPSASPMTRKLARELGVDLVRVVGSGPRGRLLREDVEAFVRQEMSRPASAAAVPAANGALAGLLPWPKLDFAKFGAVERQALARLRKISGANLSRNWVMIPHVTNFDEADITELEAFRQQVNREQKADAPKLTLLCFLIKACVEVLRRFPEFNASLEGDDLILKRYFHIGFAADTPGGLVVPVIRDADRKGLGEIAREAAELAALARSGKLKPEHMQGGCFSISSLGGIGGTGFTPIINAPEVAILGVTRAELKPKWDGTQFVPRLMVPLNLSWDHRVVDGASAARFLVALGTLLSDFRRVCL